MSNPLPKMDQATLKTLLHYDPATGIFTRLTGQSRWRGCRAGYVHQSNTKNYRKISFSGSPKKRVYYEHRLAYLYMTGEFPPEQIDHIDGNGLNNAWANLRPATPELNGWNMRTPITNTSGHIGVSWDASRNKWGAWMRRDGRSGYLGRFLDFEDAVAARIAAENIYRNGIRFNGEQRIVLESVSAELVAG